MSDLLRAFADAAKFYCTGELAMAWLAKQQRSSKDTKIRTSRLHFSITTQDALYQTNSIRLWNHPLQSLHASQHFSSPSLYMRSPRVATSTDAHAFNTMMPACRRNLSDA